MSAELTLTPNYIRIPNGMPGGGILEIDLSEVYTLEARKQEVASVSKAKAPELMHAMEKGYSYLAQRIIPKVTYAMSQAEQAMNARKAIVMLDEAPRILKEKGLSTARNPAGSADQRENILAMDAEYRELLTTFDQIRAVHELLKGKMKGFEMSYQAVKKVYDSLTTFGALNNATHQILGTGLPDEASAGDEVSDTNELKIGTAKY